MRTYAVQGRLHYHTPQPFPGLLRVSLTWLVVVDLSAANADNTDRPRHHAPRHIIVRVPGDHPSRINQLHANECHLQERPTLFHV